MVTITLSTVGAKNAANRLREFLAADGISLKQTRAYEALAQVLGYANWNTLQGLLNTTPSPAIAEYSGVKRSTNKHAARTAEELVIERLVEQAVPRTAIQFDPKKFDKFVGCYQFRRDRHTRAHTHPDEFITVMRDGDHFFIRLTGQFRSEVYPESETKFFSRHTRAQLSFNLNTQNFTESLVLHQHGHEKLAKRVDESVAKASEDTLRKYVANGNPTPERETLLRRLIEAKQTGTPNFEDMAPEFAEETKQNWQTNHRIALMLGNLTTLKFLHLKRNGWDVYHADFENGELIYEVGPLTPDHKLEFVKCYDA
jgi:hypothetical protein